MEGALYTEVVIADDHPVFRDGLRRLVQKTFPLSDVREAGTFEGVLLLAAKSAPNLFVLDLHFPGFDINVGIAILRRQCPTSSILVVSMADDDSTIDHVLAAGADGFVSKAVYPARMSEAFRMVLEGELVRLATPGAETQPDPVWRPVLTSRQKEVLHLLTLGMSNKEIARVMGISPFTVRVHVTSVLRTLGVTTRSAAAASGRELGY